MGLVEKGEEEEGEDEREPVSVARRCWTALRSRGVRKVALYG